MTPLTKQQILEFKALALSESGTKLTYPEAEQQANNYIFTLEALIKAQLDMRHGKVNNDG